MKHSRLWLTHYNFKLQPLEKQTNALNTNTVSVRAKVFDVGLQHLLVAQGEARARHVVTGSNKLFDVVLYLPLFQFISTAPHIHLTAGYGKLKSLPFIVFLLFGPSPCFYKPI